MSKASRESRKAEKRSRRQASASPNAVPRTGGSGGWPWAGLLVAAGLLVFGNSWSGPFIYDDAVTVVRNPSIRELWPLSGVLHGLVNTPTAGRPLVGLSFALNYAAGGLNVAGYHAINIALHVIAATLLFGIVRRTLAGERLRARFGAVSGGVAAACALIWMVHPLQTEVVNYLTQRTESMMGLFFFLTLYAAIRAGEAGAAGIWTGLSIAACAAGMASKETMAVAPLAVVLYDWCYRTDSFASRVRTRWPLYAGLAATWVLLGALMWSGPRSGSAGFSVAVSPVTYAMNQCLMIAHYLRLVVWPHPLLVDYGPPLSLSAWQVGPQAALIAVLGAATLTALWLRPAAGYPAAWFFLVLAPTSSLLPIATEVGAERRMYLPLAGLLVLMVTLGYLALQRVTAREEGREAIGRRHLRVGPALVAGIAMALGGVSALRNLEYRDPVVLWRSVLEYRVFPRAQNNLATELSKQHRYAESIAYYRQALQAQPESVEIRYNLAHDLELSGRMAEAIAEYREFLRRRPDPIVHNLLGRLLADTGTDGRSRGRVSRSPAAGSGVCRCVRKPRQRLSGRRAISGRRRPVRVAVEASPGRCQGAQRPRAGAGLAGEAGSGDRPPSAGGGTRAGLRRSPFQSRRRADCRWAARRRAAAVSGSRAPEPVDEPGGGGRAARPVRGCRRWGFERAGGRCDGTAPPASAIDVDLQADAELQISERAGRSPVDSECGAA